MRLLAELGTFWKARNLSFTFLEVICKIICLASTTLIWIQVHGFKILVFRISLNFQALLCNWNISTFDLQVKTLLGRCCVMWPEWKMEKVQVTVKTTEATRETFVCMRKKAFVCVWPLTSGVCPGYCEEQGAVGGAGLEEDLGDLRLEEENEQPPLILETDWLHRGRDDGEGGGRTDQSEGSSGAAT